MLEKGKLATLSLLLLTSCASLFATDTYTFSSTDMCDVEPIHLSEKVKRLISQENKFKIIDNNKLYYCECKTAVIPKGKFDKKACKVK